MLPQSGALSWFLLLGSGIVGKHGAPTHAEPGVMIFFCRPETPTDAQFGTERSWCCTKHQLLLSSFSFSLGSRPFCATERCPAGFWESVPGIQSGSAWGCPHGRRLAHFCSLIENEVDCEVHLKFQMSTVARIKEFYLTNTRCKEDKQVHLLLL